MKNILTISENVQIIYNTYIFVIYQLFPTDNLFATDLSSG